MKNYKQSKWIAFGLGVAIGVSFLNAADTPPATGDKPKDVVPWVRKATKDLPENRVGGKRPDKGGPTVEASIFFIAPKTTGFTTRELPEVYWYISEQSKKVTFTLIKGTRTELKLVLKDVQPGFHKIDLAAAAKAWKFKGLELNQVDPANGNASQVTAAYKMTLVSVEPKLVASAYVARVQAAPGQNPTDYTFQIQNELWFDAVNSLASQLSTEPAKAAAPRKQFSQLLEAEEVLRSTVGSDAPEDKKQKARAEEDKVLKQLSVPDPIDLQSDTYSVPDPIDLNSVPDPTDLQSVKERDK